LLLGTHRALKNLISALWRGLGVHHGLGLPDFFAVQLGDDFAITANPLAATGGA
jgi:hypothetical protein